MKAVKFRAEKVVEIPEASVAVTILLLPSQPRRIGQTKKDPIQNRSAKMP